MARKEQRKKTQKDQKAGGKTDGGEGKEEDDAVPCVLDVLSRALLLWNRITFQQKAL